MSRCFETPGHADHPNYLGRQPSVHRFFFLLNESSSSLNWLLCSCANAALLFLFLRFSSAIRASNCLWVFYSSCNCLRRSAVFLFCVAVFSTSEFDGDASSSASWLSSSSSSDSAASLCFFLARLFAKLIGLPWPALLEERPSPFKFQC